MPRAGLRELPTRGPVGRSTRGSLALPLRGEGQAAAARGGPYSLLEPARPHGRTLKAKIWLEPCLRLSWSRFGVQVGRWAPVCCDNQCGRVWLGNNPVSAQA